MDASIPSNDDEMFETLTKYKWPKEKEWELPFLTPEIYAATGEGEWNSGRWVQPGDSVYGIAITMCLFEALSNMEDVIFLLIFCLQQAIAIGMVQGYILYWLWQSLEPTYEVNLCTTNNLVFYACILGVFITSLLPGLLVISHEFRIIRSGIIILFSSTGFKKLERGGMGVTIACFIVGYELLIWISVLLVGINYILTAETLGDLVQAAVGITFVNELDDMAVFLYRNSFDGSYFRCDEPTIDASHFSAVFTLPIVVSAAFGIVYGIHNSYC